MVSSPKVFGTNKAHPLQGLLALNPPRGGDFHQVLWDRKMASESNSISPGLVETQRNGRKISNLPAFDSLLCADTGNPVFTGTGLPHCKQESGTLPEKSFSSP